MTDAMHAAPDHAWDWAEWELTRDEARRLAALICGAIVLADENADQAWVYLPPGTLGAVLRVLEAVTHG